LGLAAISYAIAESSSFIAHDAVYPASKTLHLKAINKTVPVYTDRLRILREVTIAKSVKPGELTVEGTLRYQACDDKQCFLPETVPLKWVLRVEALDRQRVPTELQHK
jgi:hypothetical protein